MTKLINLFICMLCLASNCFANDMRIRSIIMTSDGQTIHAIYTKIDGDTDVVTGNKNVQAWSWTAQKIGDKKFIKSVYGLANNTLYFGGYEQSYVKQSNLAFKDLSEENQDFSYANISAISAFGDGNTILMGGDDSDDDGAWLFLGKKNVNETTWSEPRLNTCTPDNIGPANINGIAVDDKTVYLGISNFNDPHASGICTSQDYGRTWNWLENFPEPNASTIFSSSKGEIIYASGFEYDDNQKQDAAKFEHLFSSIDGGKTWNAINFAEKSSDYYINAIAGSRDGSIIYAGSAAGLWINNNGIWQEAKYPKEMPHMIDALATSADGKIVAAACHGVSGHASIWISQDVGQTWIKSWPDYSK